MGKTLPKKNNSEVQAQQQGNGVVSKQPIRLRKFRGYKELVPDPYGLRS